VKDIEYEGRENWITPLDLSHGQCGSLLVGIDKQLPCKILGLHFGVWNPGGSALSGFLPLNRDEIEKLIPLKSVEVPSFEEINEIVRGELSPNGVFGGAGVINIAKVDSRHAIRQSKKSAIVPSVIHVREECTRDTAILDESDPRLGELRGQNLVYRNMSAYDEIMGRVDRGILEYATEVMKSHYGGMCPVGVKRRLLTEYEMVNGVGDYLKQLDITTSPGYPWVIEMDPKGENGKRQWFVEHILENGKKEYTMKDSLRSVVLRREDRALQGIRIPSVSYACLKDETRPKEKIALGKTRVFVCMPMDYNLLVRRYFGAFVAAMHATCCERSSSVGINPDSDWTMLQMRLSRVGDSMYEDFDYKHWDTMLHPEFFFSFVRVVNNWYGDDDDSDVGKARRVLIHELVYNYIIARNSLVLKTTGTSSGCAITAELNSFINDLIMLYVFLYMNHYGDLGYTPEAYFENVELAVYGDDVIKNVSGEFAWFCGENILPIIEELGMTVTTGDKNGTNFRYKTIEEISYLKRGFRREGATWRAPLDLEVLNDIYQWVHKSDDPFEATRVNCEMALRFAAQHKAEYFSSLQRRLNDKINRLNSRWQIQRIKPLINIREFYLSESTKSPVKDYPCAAHTSALLEDL